MVDTNHFTPWVGSDEISSTTLNTKMAELSGGITEAAVDILITASDTTEKEYLDDAFSDGGDIAFAVANSGGNETLQATIKPDTVGASEVDETATIQANKFIGTDSFGVQVKNTSFVGMQITSMPGNQRVLNFESTVAGSDLTRWRLLTNETAESGADAGSDFEIRPRNDAGGFLGLAFSMTRANKNARFYADLQVDGDFTVSGSKGFKDTHPLNSGKTLTHVAAESPRSELIYRGRVVLVNGQATVNIDTDCNETGGLQPGTFEALTRNHDVFVQNQTGWSRVRGNLNGALLTIEAEDNTSTDTVSWMVIAERVSETLAALESTDAEGRLVCEHQNPPLDMDEVTAKIDAIETVNPDGTPKVTEKLKAERLLAWKDAVRGKGEYPFAGPIKHPQTGKPVEVVPPGLRKKT